MKQTISFIEPYTEFKTVTDSNAFAIREDRPHLWLQKACCWVMGKLGAYRRDTQTKIEYRTIDADSFITRIAEQHESVFALMNRRPKKLLIGAAMAVSMLAMVCLLMAKVSASVVKTLSFTAI